MKKIWKNHKIKIILATYVVLIGVFIRFAAVPMVKNIQSKSDEIQEKIADNEITQSRVSKIPQMEDDFNAFDNKKDSLNVILDANNEVDFIKQLESMAQDTGNDISLEVQDDPSSSNNSPKPTTSSSSNSSKNKDTSIKGNLSHKDYISMKISLSGNYTGLVDFIHRLENYQYYVNIISLDISKTTEDEGGSSSPNSNQSPSFDVFSPPIGSASQLSSKPVEKKQKEILKSILNVVIYINK